MPLLAKKKQIAMVRELIGGVIPAGSPLANAANATILALDPAMAVEIDNFEREFVRDSITRLKQIPASKIGVITFGAEIKATALGTFVAGVPPWALAMESCNMKQVEVQAVPCSGSVTGGPFRHGEKVVGAGGAEALLVGDVFDGATEFFIDKDSFNGTAFAAEVVTGDSTGALITATGISVDEGFAWYPITDPIKSIDILSAVNTAQIGSLIKGDESNAIGRVTKAVTVSDTTIEFVPLFGAFINDEVLIDLTGAQDEVAAAAIAEQFLVAPTVSARLYEDGVAGTIRGARGNWVIEGEANRPVKISFSHRGILDAFADIPNIAGINYDLANPPLFQAASVGFAVNEGLVAPWSTLVDSLADEISSCFASITLDIGNQIAERICASAVGGIEEIFIGDRQGTGSFDPEATPEGLFPWMDQWFTGDVARIRFQIGASKPNFTVQCPGLQWDSVASGDRDGILTRDVSVILTGGNNYNLNGGDVTIPAAGGDNEFVLIYHTLG